MYKQIYSILCEIVMLNVRRTREQNTMYNITAKRSKFRYVGHSDTSNIYKCRWRNANPFLETTPSSFINEKIS